jgi:hypothetical protein
MSAAAPAAALPVNPGVKKLVTQALAKAGENKLKAYAAMKTASATSAAKVLATVEETDWFKAAIQSALEKLNINRCLDNKDPTDHLSRANQLRTLAKLRANKELGQRVADAIGAGPEECILRETISQLGYGNSCGYAACIFCGEAKKEALRNVIEQLTKAQLEVAGKGKLSAQDRALAASIAAEIVTKMTKDAAKGDNSSGEELSSDEEDLPATVTPAHLRKLVFRLVKAGLSAKASA